MSADTQTHSLTHSHTNKPPTAGVQLVGHTSINVSLSPQKLLEETQNTQEEFKDASELACTLVKDTPQDAVNAMLAELKQLKERLVLVQRLIPDALKPLRPVLPQVESLENGIADLAEWIREGNALLASHKIDGNINVVEDRLENHQVR